MATYSRQPLQPYSKSTPLNQNSTPFPAQAGEFVVDYSYYMGIIDYQQPYSLRKKVLYYTCSIGGIMANI
jgi:hypothetical protein